MYYTRSNEAKRTVMRGMEGDRTRPAVTRMQRIVIIVKMETWLARKLSPGTLIKNCKIKLCI
jgi:hypothetical protein